MNNNINFDPMTGQPIQNNVHPVDPVSNQLETNSNTGNIETTVSIDSVAQPATTEINIHSGNQVVQSQQPDVPAVQPISVENQQPDVPTVQPVSIENQQSNIPSVQSVSVENQQSEIIMQNELQNIPTVEQGKQDFINNIQSSNEEKLEEKKDSNKYVFAIVLFIVILLSIYFLFPLFL